MPNWRDPKDDDYTLPRGKSRKSTPRLTTDSPRSFISLLASNRIGTLVIISILLASNVLTYVAGSLSWQQKAKDNDWMPKREWKEVAHESGWAPVPEGDDPWHYVTSSVEDGRGKRVQLKIDILSPEYRWAFGRSDGVEPGGDEEDLRRYVRRLDLSGSEGIICVGAASVEGDKTEQESLALKRADTLTSIVRERAPAAPLYVLNLGRFQGDQRPRTAPATTAPQRRVIIIEVLAQEPDADLEEAVYAALSMASQSGKIFFNVKDYSTFELQRGGR